MDPHPVSSTPKKVKFAPKAPSRRPAKPHPPKTDGDNSDSDNEEARTALLHRLKERLGRGANRNHKNSSVRVARNDGVASSTSNRISTKPTESNDDKGLQSKADKGLECNAGKGLEASASANGQVVVSSSSTAVNAKTRKDRKEYREPWDYSSNYPITLPFRKPYSGDPELLDETEFGEAAAADDCDEEDTMNSALELGLLEENENPQMIFLQLPAPLPLLKQAVSADVEERALGSKISESGGIVVPDGKGKEKVGGGIAFSRDAAAASRKGKEMAGSSTYPRWEMSPKMGCSLEDLPAGYVGKMLVYKSGAVKLKLGDVEFEVSAGSDCTSAQDVITINTVDQQCCVLGELHKRAVLTPDVDSLLGSG